MISYLAGTVLEVLPKEVIVLTSSGVGYGVFPAGSVLASCTVGNSIKMYISTIVRETEISLYGFDSFVSKQFFERLITVSGIGPKMGVEMLSIPQSEFLKAVESGDVVFLTGIKGVGKKMAQKLILELQGKLDLTPEDSCSTVSGGVSFSEASEALANLGYDKKVISQVLVKAPKDASAENLVTYFLSNHA